MPSETTYESLCEFIKQLPNQEAPGVHGLHPNAAINFERSASLMLVDELTNQLVGREASSSDCPLDSSAMNAQTVLNKVPECLDQVLAEARRPVSYGESFNGVLHQEIARYNCLLRTISSSLQGLADASQGLIPLSAVSESVATSMWLQQVPEFWLSHSYVSSKPFTAYLEDVTRRISFFRSWVSDGPPPIFWISGFFVIRSFLIGTLQSFTRQHVLPFDLAELDIRALATEPSVRPETGAHVNGLFLEACRWDVHQQDLTEPAENVLCAECPTVWLRPCKVGDILSFRHYECPVYLVPSRRRNTAKLAALENLVFYLKLASSVAPSHWIQRGAVALTQLES